MSSATGTDRPQGRIARLRAHPLGQLIERGVRLAAIGSAVVVVHDRVLSFQRFASEPDCGCLPPEDVDELVATWPADAPPSERHETPQIDAERVTTMAYSRIPLGMRFQELGGDEWVKKSGPLSGDDFVVVIDKADEHLVAPYAGWAGDPVPTPFEVARSEFVDAGDASSD